jgi:hypothetical protein
VLNLAAYRNSLARSTKSTSSHIKVLRSVVDTRFQVLFHSPPGVLFTFPSRYFFAIGHQVVFSLRRWSSLIPHKVSRVSWYSGMDWVFSVFIYRAFTFFGGAFQLSSINLFTSNVQPNPRNKFLVWALSLSLAATKEIDFSFLFLRVLRCFSSPGLPL